MEQFAQHFHSLQQFPNTRCQQPPLLQITMKLFQQQHLPLSQVMMPQKMFLFKQDPPLLKLKMILRMRMLELLMRKEPLLSFLEGPA